MIRPRHVFITPLVALFLVQATDGHAQDLRYTTQSETRFGGMMGGFPMPMGQGDQKIETVTMIKGRLMRQDTESSSGIVDIESGTLLILDHDARTFTRVVLADWMETTAAMRQEMAASMPAEGAGAVADPDVSVDRTGERMEIAGYPAEQVIVTVVAPSADPSGAASGSFVLLTEVWVSQEFPAARMLDEFAEALPEGFQGGPGGRGGPPMSMVQGGSNADVESLATARTEEEIERLGGFPMKRIQRHVTVPAGTEFDRDLALSAEDSPMSMADLMATAMRPGGREELRRRAEQLERGVEEEAQTTTMTVIEEITRVEVVELRADLFRPPENYTEVTMPGGGRL